MSKRQRTARRTCNRLWHVWKIAAPYSWLKDMGRVHCTRCGRYQWLTGQQYWDGSRQRKVATWDREWTAERIRDAVTS